MATQAHDNDPEVARTKLLQLLLADEWELTDGTREEGKVALRWLRNREPTEIEMVDYVISLLENNPPRGVRPKMTRPKLLGR